MRRLLSPLLLPMKGFSILLFLPSLFSFLLISYAVDTLTTAQNLTDGNTIVSAGGHFELGFFTPGTDSRYRYVGIWYKKISIRTVFWVANRESPLTDASGVLKLNEQGVLALLNSTNSIIWSSNSSTSSTQISLVARLLDTGNLVVEDANGVNNQNYLWESFDYPCDTMMPGMKLGRNSATGIDRYLRSWKTSNDAARGDYTFHLDALGFPQLFLTNGSVDQFRSGPWNGLRFSGSPGLKPNPIYTYSFVFTQEEIYYAYELINSSVYSRLELNPDGVLQRFTWNYRTQGWIPYLNAPADNCDSYGLCHDYGSCNIGNSPVCGCLDKFVPESPRDWDRADWSKGCVRKTPLDCENGDGFVKYSGIKLPDTRYSWFNKSMSLNECQKVCLDNCSCMAYANIDIRAGGSGCFLWHGDLMDIRMLPEDGQDIYIRMASSELDSTRPLASSDDKKGKKIRIALALVAAGMLLLGLTLTFYFWERKKRKRKQQQEIIMREESVGHGTGQWYTNESDKEDHLSLLDFATVAIATSNFSNYNKLGEGGFGPVYKGKLKEGQEIAVKRLSKNSAQGLDEIRNEVACIAKVQHRNLVKLLGCCIQGEEKMLIYEYMPNKSLDSFIFDKARSVLLDWPKRFNVINGIARGLLYLHQDSPHRIIHRDLKASNVLLDSEMNPKISDFGMARIFAGNETAGKTHRVVGTYGYLSPEYAVDGLFSTKSDVFSFGVLALEIVSGKRNRGFVHLDHQHNLLGHAWKLHNEDRSLELINQYVVEPCYLPEVLRSIHVALLCVQQSPEDRPSMSGVVFMLGGEGSLPRPKEPGFFTKRNPFYEGEQSISSHAPVSFNDMSITLLVAR